MRRLILCAIMMGSLGSACTAIVLGKLSDSKDYKTNDFPAAAGACDLITEGDANACSACIQKNCADNVAYACNGGTQEKKWFADLQECAQNPEYSEFEWGCSPLSKLESVPTSDPTSDTAQQALANNCVVNSCLQGDVPDCKRCDIQIQKSADDPVYAQLPDDPCGSCMYMSCNAQIVACCGTAPISDYVQKCAYTALPQNLATCRSLANPDAGSVDTSEYDDAGTQCLQTLSQCFAANCLGSCQ